MGEIFVPESRGDNDTYAMDLKSEIRRFLAKQDWSLSDKELVGLVMNDTRGIINPKFPIEVVAEFRAAMPIIRLMQAEALFQESNATTAIATALWLNQRAYYYYELAHYTSQTTGGSK